MRFLNAFNHCTCALHSISAGVNVRGCVPEFHFETCSGVRDNILKNNGACKLASCNLYHELVLGLLNHQSTSVQHSQATTTSVHLEFTSSTGEVFEDVQCSLKWL